MDLSELGGKFPYLKNLEPLKHGGFKSVFKAVHDVHGKVVLKIVKPVLDKVELIERIKREIRASEIIKSDHIPRVIDSLISDNDIWIIEEYIAGETLRDIISAGKTFSLQEIYIFLETLLSTIILAEKKKIVHRDIKPENIIIDNAGKIWLIDFGIARHLDLDTLTDPNAPFAPCTIGYASAEQFRNRKREM